MNIIRGLLVAVLLGTVCMTTTSSMPESKLSASSSSYDIAEIYELIDVPRGSKVKDGYGNMVAIEGVYAPTRLDTGNYSVRVSRVGSNFYRIDKTDYYIETKFCYEYAYYEEVILKITSNYGYTKGEIIFD